MKTHRDFSSRILAPIVLLSAYSANAAQEYEFASALLDRDLPAFTTTDLVEHLAAQLERRTETAIEAKMIKAALRRHEALRASRERRATLLEESAKYYKEVLSSPKTFRLYALAEQAGAATERELLLAKCLLAKDQPENADKLLLEAAALAAKFVAQRKAGAAALFSEFQKRFAIYQSETRNNPGRVPPRSIMQPLEQSFDAWIVADKRYVVACMEQLECHSDGGQQRKTLADALVTYCEEKSINEVILGFPTLSAWYAFMQGKASAAIGDEPAAAEAWDAIVNAESAGQNAEQKKQFFELKKHVLRETVALHMKSENFSAVVELVAQVMRRPDEASLYSDDAGKGIILDYAKALIAPADASAAEFETAAAKLGEFIEKERKLVEFSPWVFKFSVQAAELAEQARERELPLTLSAQQWYHAASGMFFKGQQFELQHTEQQREKNTARAAELFKNARDAFSGALKFYQRAISIARDERTPLHTRLSTEPKAWFEMGLCHLKLKQYYEAIIACAAMRARYLPPRRELWLNAWMKNESPGSKKRLGELLQAVDALVERSGKNLVYAFEQNRASHNSPENSWDAALIEKLIEDSELASRLQDPKYYEAQHGLADGAILYKSSKTAADVQQRNAMLAEAAAKYMSSAVKFGEVPASAAVYELSLYQAAAAYFRAYEIISIARPPAEIERVRDLAKKSLDGFASYQDFISAHPAKNEKVSGQRAAFKTAILFAQTSLFSAAGDWNSAVKCADDYLAAQPAGEGRETVLFNKFRALLELAAGAAPPQCDVYLALAETSVDEIRKSQPHAPQIDSIYKALSRRYVAAAAMAQQKTLEHALTQKYFAKAADAEQRRLALRESPVLSDCANVLFLLSKSGDKRRAADMAGQMLEKFDPSNMNATIPDQPDVWQGILNKMNGVIRYSVLSKWDRCKADHKLLIDYLYDTREAAGLPENDQRRPDFDRYNQSMEKALIQLESIRNNYPDCQTLDPNLGEGGNAMLAAIDNEIDYRRKIVAARELLTGLALSVSEQLERDGDAENARKYRETASAQIKILLTLNDSTELQLKAGDLDMQNGKFDEAMRIFQSVRIEADDNSVLYFEASKRISILLAKTNQWQEAADFPEFLVLTGADDTPRVKQRWPELHRFLARCYSSGAKKPAGIKLKP